LCIILGIGISLWFPATGFGYRMRIVANGMPVDYVPGEGGNHRISSALGEPRTVKGTTGTEVNRFHTGVDVPLAEENWRIVPIEAGVVTKAISAGYDSYVEVLSSSGRTFRYYHTIPATGITNGATVWITSVVGTIDETAEHLHLTEYPDTDKQYVVNPQRPGGLEYVDRDVPRFDDAKPISFKAADGSIVTGSIVPVREYGGWDDGLNTQVEAMPRLGGVGITSSMYEVSGVPGKGGVDIIAAVTDRPPDSGGRKGIYRLLTRVMDEQGVVLHECDSRFDTVLFATADEARIDVNKIYPCPAAVALHDGSISYFATNAKVNLEGVSAKRQAEDGNTYGAKLDFSDEKYHPGLYMIAVAVFDQPDTSGAMDVDQRMIWVRVNKVELESVAINGKAEAPPSCYPIRLNFRQSVKNIQVLSPYGAVTFRFGDVT
jgi:hypothetical protein